MIYKGKGGIEYNLEATPIAAGGEGEIYNIIGKPTSVAKLYKPGKESTEKEFKLVRMVDFPPNKNILSQIAWPQDVLNIGGKFVGFVMSKMQINEDLNVVYEYGSSSKYPQMPWKNRIIIAKNLCAVLNSVHEDGYTCGDLNPKNISVNPNTGYIVFLDTDSYHVQDGSKTYRCDVGIPEYLPAEVQVKMRGGSTLATAALPTFSPDTDNFALAIHIFQLLMNGVHPFACAIIPSQSSVTAPQPSDNIIKGEFPFMQNIPGVRIPVFAPKITILPQEMQDLFRRAFINGHTNPSARPTPEEWHKALSNLETELKTCSNVSYHEYYKVLSSCPWCDVNKAFAQPFKPKAGLVQTPINAPNTTPTSSVYPPNASSPSNSSIPTPPIIPPTTKVIKSTVDKKLITTGVAGVLIVTYLIVRSFHGTATDKSQIAKSASTSVINKDSVEQKVIQGKVTYQVLSIKNVQASSVLRPDPGITYYPSNVIDGDLNTSWVEGVDGDGIGEWITLNLTDPSSIQEIVISNGYRKNESLYLANNRVAKVRLSFSNGMSVIENLDDIYNNKEQSIKLDQPVVSNFVKLEFEGIYKGNKYSDTCISEIKVLGSPGQT